MDELQQQIVDDYYKALTKVAEGVGVTPQLLDEVVWLDMYKAFMNWHAITRHSGLKYAEAADAGLYEFKKRFRT